MICFEITSKNVTGLCEASHVGLGFWDVWDLDKEKCAFFHADMLHCEAEETSHMPGVNVHY
jgi:hypothetical protein